MNRLQNVSSDNPKPVSSSLHEEIKSPRARKAQYEISVLFIAFVRQGLGKEEQQRKPTYLQRLEEIRVAVRRCGGHQVPVHQDNVRFDERVDAEAVPGRQEAQPSA